MRLCLRLVLPVAVLAGFVPALAIGADLLPPEMPLEQAIDHYVDARLQEVGVSAARVETTIAGGRPSGRRGRWELGRGPEPPGGAGSGWRDEVPGSAGS